MAGSQKLGKLKARLAEITDKIDEADNRKAEAKSKMVEAEARVEQADGECKSMERKLFLLREDKDSKESRFADVESRLASATSKYDEATERVRELEDNETNEDERVQQLEEEVKAADERLDENQHNFTDINRKNVVLQRSLDRARTKRINLEQLEEQLRNGIAKANEKIRNLEDNEVTATEEEERNAGEIETKQIQYDEYVTKYDTAIKGIEVLNLHINKVERDIEEWEKKIKKLEDDMAAMDDLSDDDE